MPSVWLSMMMPKIKNFLSIIPHLTQQGHRTATLSGESRNLKGMLKRKQKHWSNAFAKRKAVWAFPHFSIGDTAALPVKTDFKNDLLQTQQRTRRLLNSIMTSTQFCRYGNGIQNHSGHRFSFFLCKSFCYGCWFWICLAGLRWKTVWTSLGMSTFQYGLLNSLPFPLPCSSKKIFERVSGECLKEYQMLSGATSRFNLWKQWNGVSDIFFDLYKGSWACLLVSFFCCKLRRSLICFWTFWVLSSFRSVVVNDHVYLDSAND